LPATLSRERSSKGAYDDKAALKNRRFVPEKY
jgi:hypothetical protein